MADFSRIQVTPAEEEDIVIQAGAVEHPEASASTEPPAPERASYEATTLEDLHRTRMSGMQKAIIAIAVVAVVAFIIWYVLLR